MTRATNNCRDAKNEGDVARCNCRPVIVIFMHTARQCESFISMHPSGERRATTQRLFRNMRMRMRKLTLTLTHKITLICIVFRTSWRTDSDGQKQIWRARATLAIRNLAFWHISLRTIF